MAGGEKQDLKLGEEICLPPVYIFQVNLQRYAAVILKTAASGCRCLDQVVLSPPPLQIKKEI